MTAKAESKKTRMSIDVPLKDYKRIKIMAAAKGLSIPEFVIECIYEKIYPEKVKYPNKTTHKAMENAGKSKTIKAKDFDHICNQLGI